MRSIVVVLLSLTAGVAAAENNRCEIAVSGDASTTIKIDAPGAASQGKAGAATDYWMSEGQIRAGIEILQGVGGKLTPAEKQRKVDEAMKKDPRFMLLIVNCLADEGGIIIGASRQSHYDDVPMKAASYALVPTKSPRAGEFTVMFHLSPRGKRESYTIKDAGKLVLTQFDRKAIAGTFRFKAEQRGKTAKRIDVTGSFNYRCFGEACQK